MENKRAEKLQRKSRTEALSMSPKLSNRWIIGRRHMLEAIDGIKIRDGPNPNGFERGAGEERIRAASAVVDAGGPFAWERGPWSSAVTIACPLLKDFSPGRSRSEDGYVGPPMARALKSCPVYTCLRYGQTNSRSSPEHILNDSTVDDISALVINSSSVPIIGTKSRCFRMTGPKEMIPDTSPRKKRSITDERLIVCNKVHNK